MAIIGRDAEKRRFVEVLGERGLKLLSVFGPAGFGKTTFIDYAIAEHIATNSDTLYLKYKPILTRSFSYSITGENFFSTCSRQFNEKDFQRRFIRLKELNDIINEVEKTRSDKFIKALQDTLNVDLNTAKDLADIISKTGLVNKTAHPRIG